MESALKLNADITGGTAADCAILHPSRMPAVFIVRLMLKDRPSFVLFLYKNTGIVGRRYQQRAKQLTEDRQHNAKYNINNDYLLLINNDIIISYNYKLLLRVTSCTTHSGSTMKTIIVSFELLSTHIDSCWTI